MPTARHSGSEHDVRKTNYGFGGAWKSKRLGEPETPDADLARENSFAVVFEQIGTILALMLAGALAIGVIVAALRIG